MVTGASLHAAASKARAARPCMCMRPWQLPCRCLPRADRRASQPCLLCTNASTADVLLSWDYWALERQMAEGGGPIAELPTIPKQFGSVEVGGACLGPAAPLGPKLGLVLAPACGHGVGVWGILHACRAGAWAAAGVSWHGTAHHGMACLQQCCRAHLPAHFPPPHASLQEYVRVFEPLLLEECAAQMLRGQEEGQVLTSQVRAAAGAAGWAQAAWHAVAIGSSGVHGMHACMLPRLLHPPPLRHHCPPPSPPRLARSRRWWRRRRRAPRTTASSCG